MNVEVGRRGHTRPMLRLPFVSSPPSVPVGDGLQVAKLGFGTWSWGNKLLWGYDEAADDELREAFGTAVGGLGSQKFFFDTGDSYGTGELEGRAESLLGDFRAGIKRSDRCVIGTKLAVYPNRLTGASFEAAWCVVPRASSGWLFAHTGSCDAPLVCAQPRVARAHGSRPARDCAGALERPKLSAVARASTVGRAGALPRGGPRALRGHIELRPAAAAQGQQVLVGAWRPAQRQPGPALSSLNSAH